MSDIDFPAIDRRSEPIGAHGSNNANERILVVRPESFFSHRFHLYVEEQPADNLRIEAANQPSTGLRRLLDFSLVLTILLIGVPLLLYCILS